MKLWHEHCFMRARQHATLVVQSL